MSEDLKPHRYEAIALSSEGTVVAEFVPDPGGRDADYQSEAALERDFIAQLRKQAYDYLALTSEAAVIANLRAQLEALNKVSFSDAEWQRFFTTCIAGAYDGIVEKTARIQEDHVQLLKRDDGSTKNISLIDKQNIHNNGLQVINQYEVPRGEQGVVRSTRFDVTILVNGLPMVHVELKRRGVDIREAFNQINRYQRDSFWAGSGLTGHRHQAMAGPIGRWGEIASQIMQMHATPRERERAQMNGRMARIAFGDAAASLMSDLDQQHMEVALLHVRASELDTAAKYAIYALVVLIAALRDVLDALCDSAWAVNRAAQSGAAEVPAMKEFFQFAWADRQYVIKCGDCSNRLLIPLSDTVI